MLFIDARHIFRQIDRAHRDFTPEQHEFLANIVRFYRGEQPEFVNGSEKMLEEQFPDLVYIDVPGLCKVASIDEIENHGWTLSPGRYVGVAVDGEEDFDFARRFGELSEEFRALTSEASQLAEIIGTNASSFRGRIDG